MMPSSCLATSTCLLGYRWLYVSIVVNIKYRHTFSFPFAPHAAICSAEDFLSINL